MKYAEWLKTVPSEITNDPIWKLEVHRLALFAGDIGWEDIQKLSKENLMFSIQRAIINPLPRIRSTNALTHLSSSIFLRQPLTTFGVQP